jgi:hypothetical protein
MQDIASSNDSTIFRYCSLSRGDASQDSQDKNGGIIRVLNSSRLLIENCCFSYATADSGGALYAKNSSFKVKIVFSIIVQPLMMEEPFLLLCLI